MSLWSNIKKFFTPRQSTLTADDLNHIYEDNRRRLAEMDSHYSRPLPPFNNVMDLLKAGEKARFCPDTFTWAHRHRASLSSRRTDPGPAYPGVVIHHTAIPRKRRP